MRASPAVILIHTSVKLVTDQRHYQADGGGILIHTSVKLVTGVDLNTVRELIF